MGRRASLAWLVAVIAGVFMVVPTLASAQEQGSTEADSQLTEVTADDVTTTEEAPATEVPPADPPAPPVEPAVTDSATGTEAAAPDSGSFEGSTDASKAPAEPAASTEAVAASSAPAPEPEPAVSAVKAEATDSPGNDGGGSDATAGRAVARGGGELEATKASSESKPGCLARGGANEIHNTFPNDGSCAQSLFEGGLPALPGTTDNITLVGPGGVPVELDIWSPDGGNTVHAIVVSGGPVGISLYVKGGPPHEICTYGRVETGGLASCVVATNPNNNTPFGFSHLDVCVRPPTVVEIPPVVTTDTPPPLDEDEVLTQEQRDEQREEQREEQQEELEEAVPPIVPTAVAPTPEEALPFTGLDTGWLVLMSLALLGSGLLLRRKVS